MSAGKELGENAQGFALMLFWGSSEVVRGSQLPVSGVEGIAFMSPGVIPVAPLDSKAHISSTGAQAMKL